MESYTEKADKWHKPHFSLYGPADEPVCSIKLSMTLDTGTVTIADTEYQIVSKPASNLWKLMLKDTMVCRAREPKVLDKKVFIEQFAADGTVQNRVRMQQRKDGFRSFYYYKVDAGNGDDAALDESEGKDEEYFMRIKMSIMTGRIAIEKEKDAQLDAAYLAFCIVMFHFMWSRKAVRGALPIAEAFLEGAVEGAMAQKR